MSTEGPVLNTGIILDEVRIEVPGLLMGELPGKPQLQDEEVQHLALEQPLVEPRVAVGALLQNGGLSAVCQVVAQGTAGSGVKVVPRFKTSTPEDKQSWPAGAEQQLADLQVFVQTGCYPEDIAATFRRQELDRVVLGWGGVVIRRELPLGLPPGEIPKPIALGRLEAAHCRFTRPDLKPTMVPVPVWLPDGRLVWVERPRYFRRLRYQDPKTGRPVWYKEADDWRAMNAITGARSSGWRHEPALKPFTKGRYFAGATPDNGPPALEVQHWSTPFPGAGPYGVSAWHAELTAVNASYAHVRLLLTYLRSGLHSVILAAASQRWEQASLDNAVAKINQLGRGEGGLGSLIALQLVPHDNPRMGQLSLKDQEPADHARMILQEVSTKLQPELLDKVIQETLALRLSGAERIPGILIGRADTYNHATAQAAWDITNKLRFSPHHVARETFLDRLLAEMGIVHWALQVTSSDWTEPEKLSALTQAAAVANGVSVNNAMRVMALGLGLNFEPITTWWGDIPMALVETILKSQDPQATLDSLELKGNPKIDTGRPVTETIAQRLSWLEQAMTKIAASAPKNDLMPQASY